MKKFVDGRVETLSRDVSTLTATVIIAFMFPYSPYCFTVARAFFVTTALLLLAACAPAIATPTPAVSTPTLPALTPYHSPTPTPSITPLPSATATPLGAPTSTPTPSLTPTPFLYTIKKDDTFGGLALRYGSSIEAIKTANPDINPNYLVIGQQIVIPLPTPAPGTPTVTPSPSATLFPAQTEAPVCYHIADGGAWCFLLARNPGAQALENLSAAIILVSGGEEITRTLAVAPLNLLPPGRALPLSAYFPPPLPAEFTVRAELLDVFVTAPGDERYLSASVNVQNERITTNGRQATVTGELLLPVDSRPPAILWLAVIAYDENEAVVGLRKWETAQVCVGSSAAPTGQQTVEPTSSETCLTFEITVYSLGPAIARLEVLAEARP